MRYPGRVGRLQLNNNNDKTAAAVVCAPLDPREYVVDVRRGEARHCDVFSPEQAIPRARPNVNYNSHVTIKIKSHQMAARTHIIRLI